MKRLQRALSRHFQEEGEFSPFTYTVGMESSFQEAFASGQDYPLKQPVDDETFAQFARSLTLIHESVHAAQFFTTAFGLRTLRYTLILLKRLREGNAWQLPLLQTLFDETGNIAPSSPQERVLNGSVVFLDVMDQMRLHEQHDPHDGDQGGIRLYFLPWSPHFFLDAGTAELDHRLQLAKQLEAGGFLVRRLPVLAFLQPPTDYRIVLNAAALMETYATLTELNHIQNAFGVTAEEALELLPQAMRYHAVLRYALESGLCDVRGLIPTMLVCIDAALMYDPFVLFDVPWAIADPQGRSDRYVGETFLAVCDAVRKIGQAQTADYDGVANFYRAVCVEAGLPSPDWMAQKTYDVAATLAARATGKDVLLGRVITAHRDALKFRLDRGPVFPFILPTTAPLFDVIETVLPVISFYNLHTRQADPFDPHKIDAVSVHTILTQAIMSPQIECPLKMGEPFFCSSATLEQQRLCVWTVDQKPVSECLVDILERLFGFKPGAHEAAE
ncbi:MAG TPA: hypothetical protein VJZ76_03415 [Thermoanaerobaculia bacterium]|nr:hypothetical protein [Thermoanaerobaculia bacterium]